MVEDVGYLFYIKDDVEFDQYYFMVGESYGMIVKVLISQFLGIS